MQEHFQSRQGWQDTAPVLGSFQIIEFGFQAKPSNLYRGFVLLAAPRDDDADDHRRHFFYNLFMACYVYSKKVGFYNLLMACYVYSKKTSDFIIC